jgi:hypothetical protein
MAIVPGKIPLFSVCHANEEKVLHFVFQTLEFNLVKYKTVEAFKSKSANEILQQAIGLPT